MQTVSCSVGIAEDLKILSFKKIKNPSLKYNKEISLFSNITLNKEISLQRIRLPESKIQIFIYHLCLHPYYL